LDGNCGNPQLLMHRSSSTSLNSKKSLANLLTTVGIARVVSVPTSFLDIYHLLEVVKKKPNP